MEVTNLPKSNKYDCLLTVTDRFTKMIHLLPTETTASAKEIARLFIRHVVRLHGIPQNIISDRDTKFCSNFWKAIMNSLNVQLKMRVPLHTPKLMARVKERIEQLLQC